MIDVRKWVTGQLNNKPSLMTLVLKPHCVYFSYLHENSSFQFLSSICQTAGCPV